MIKLYDQVPRVYSEISRDFQYLSWLINIMLNYVKHNVDSIYDLPSTEIDPRLTELLAITLGFKIKRNYDKDQLAALVSIIPSMLKYKGTIKAIKMAGDALIKASGAAGTFDCEVEDNNLIAVLPKDLIDTTLFLDILPYILPAGMTCRIVRRTQERPPLDSIELRYDDILYGNWYEDVSWDADNQISTGVSGLFDINSDRNTIFTNYTNENMPKLNTGMAQNTVIPMLGSVMEDPKSERNLTTKQEEKSNK